MEPGPVHARPAPQSHVQASQRELMKLGGLCWRKPEYIESNETITAPLDDVEMAVLRQNISSLDVHRDVEGHCLV